MSFSIFSLFMAMLFVCIVMGALRIIFSNPRVAYTLHPDFLTILVWLLFLRLALPGSFIMGFRMLWLPLFDKIECALDTFEFLGITGFGWISWIWLAGSVAAWLHMRHEDAKADIFLDMLMKDSEVHKIQDFIPDYVGPDFRVLVCPHVNQSFVLGDSMQILIPTKEMTPEEYEFVLLHEVTHLVNDDGTYLKVYRWIKIIYWWFWPIYRFKPLLDLFYEIRVDLMVNWHRMPEYRLAYSEALLRFSSPSQKSIRLRDEPEAAPGFARMKKEPIESRIHFLLNSNFEKPMKTNVLLMLIPVLFAFLSAIILLSEYTIF